MAGEHKRIMGGRDWAFSAALPFVAARDMRGRGTVAPLQRDVAAGGRRNRLLLRRRKRT